MALRVLTSTLHWNSSSENSWLYLGVKTGYLHLEVQDFDIAVVAVDINGLQVEEDLVALLLAVLEDLVLLVVQDVVAVGLG